MILALMKRDPAWRVIAFATAAAAVTARFLRPDLFAAVFVPLSFMLFAMLRMPQRATLFEAGLPIDGRDLMKARMYFLLLSVWLPIGASLLTAVVVQAGAIEAAFHHLTGLGVMESLAIVILQTWRLPEFGVGQGEALTLWGALMTIYFLATFNLTGRSYDLAMAGAAVSAIAWLSWAWPRVPLALTCAPGRLSAARRNGRAGVDSRAFFPAMQWTPLVRALHPRQTIMWLAFAGIMPLMMNNLAFSLFYVSPVLVQATPGINWSMTLPVSRRKILLAALVPFFVVFTAAFLVGGSVWPMNHMGRPGILVNPYAPDQLQVPFTYWEKARAAAPQLTAPWGETSAPITRRILMGTYYNPYAVGAGNSPKFRDWQFRRATKAIYGREIPFARSKDLEQARPLLSAPRPRFLMLVTLAGIGILLCIVALLPQWPVLHSLYQRALTIVISGVLPALLIMALAMLPLFLLPGTGNNVALELWVQRISAVLPANSAGMVAVSLSCLGGLVFLLDRLFARVEMNTSVPKAMEAITYNGGSVR